MKQAMPSDLLRRCGLVLKRYQNKEATQEDALQEIFKLMKYPDAAKVRASEFQKYVDAIMGGTEPPKVTELEAEVFKSWKL